MSGKSRKPLAAQSSKLLPGRSGCQANFFICLVNSGGFLSSLPALDQCADIAFENLGQVVMTVELVFVGDTNKALDGLGNRHSQFSINYSNPCHFTAAAKT